MSPEEFQQIELRFKRYVRMQQADQGLMFDVEPSVHEHLWGDMTFRLKADILSDDLPPEALEQRKFVRYQIPASTWQMFKKRHAQAWWLRRLVTRWPVQYEEDPDRRGQYATCTFNLERFQTYPESRLRVRDHGRPVRMYTSSTEWSFEEGPE